MPQPVREQLEPEGIIDVAERVHVRQRFSGSVSGSAVVALQVEHPEDVLAALPTRSLAFAVSPDFVFHMLGVRV
ncbi:MAG: hypothetical protein QOD39_843, partial [Mycobacterium sp.]|nr:hypothetical protein [Mycobacterium sp.]